MKLPASLSPAWIDGVLRAELGFEGVVISDDSEMGAIRQAVRPARHGAVWVVDAGADVLLFSNTARFAPPGGAGAQDPRRGGRGEARFPGPDRGSYGRIVALKRRIGR